MHRAAAEGPFEQQTVSRSSQASAADLISVAGHSRGLRQTPLADRCSRVLRRGEQWLPQGPRPRNSSVPSSRSSQSSGLCPKTLLVRVRLGGGAATRNLVTHHQGGERKRWSNQTVRLRGFCPDVPAQSVLDRRKEHHAGSTRYRPVRPWARSLPSAVTRRQSD